MDFLTRVNALMATEGYHDVFDVEDTLADGVATFEIEFDGAENDTNEAYPKYRLIIYLVFPSDVNRAPDMKARVRALLPSLQDISGDLRIEVEVEGEDRDEIVFTLVDYRDLIL